MLTRDVNDGHQEEGAHERNGQAHHDPERELQAQKQGQNQEHQAQHP